MRERNTFQKKAVREIVCKLDHPSAGAVYKAVHKKYPTISRATVFRICASLANKGELLRFPVSDGEDRFDTTLTPHYHVVCTQCGRVADLMLPYMGSLEETAGNLSDFVITEHIVQFKGICPECTQKT